MKRFLIALWIAGIAWGVAAWLDVAGQRKLFYEDGREVLSDFWMPKTCLESGYASTWSGEVGVDPASLGRRTGKPAGDIVECSDWYPSKNGLMFITGERDKVYPALALLPYAPFPATKAGGWWFTGICAAVFLAAMWVVGLGGTRRGTESAPYRWMIVLIPFTMPFLFALERGNPVWLSAAAVGVFLAWWDDEKGWKRSVAAVCLAVAAVMKIAPAALGLLYLVGMGISRKENAESAKSRDWVCRPAAQEIAICVVAAVVLFLAPWMFVKEGFGAIPMMLMNAANHADSVLRAADFGFVQPWRAVRIALGLDVQNPWTGMYLVARISQLFGLVALVIGARRRDYLLLVGGMLLAAGNMYYYGVLYLLPVFVMEMGDNRSRSKVEVFLWFVILCPLQIVVLGHSANAILCNLAVMAMMALRRASASVKAVSLADVADK